MPGCTQALKRAVSAAQAAANVCKAVAGRGQRRRQVASGSQITGNGIWALVITGELLVITGDGDY